MKRKDPKFKYSHIMLIDDNELDNFINEKTIEANHFAKKIYTTTSAKSALEFLHNLTTIGEEYSQLYPEVIFIDINMPMIDGFQFIETYKKTADHNLHKPKLVILTSSVYHEDKEKAGSISKDIFFLNKPLNSEMLAKL